MKRARVGRHDFVSSEVLRSRWISAYERQGVYMMSTWTR